MKRLSIIALALIAAIFGVLFFLSSQEIKATERPTAYDFSEHANVKDEVLIPNIAQDIYHSNAVKGAPEVGISLANQKVIPLGNYVPAWNCVATFATYMETSDGDFIMGYVLLGGHDGYRSFLEELDGEHYPFQETIYGVIVDVSKDEIPVDPTTAVEVADPICGKFQLLFNESTFNGTMNVPGVSETDCVLKDGKICFGDSGTPVLQDNKLVGWVSYGDADGSSLFQMTNASVIIG